jgi:hypothetical protein
VGVLSGNIAINIFRCWPITLGKSNNSLLRMFTCHTGQVSGSVMFFAVEGVEGVEAKTNQTGITRQQRLECIWIRPLKPTGLANRISGKPNF